MTTRRRQRFVTGQVIWMLGAIVTLVLLGSLSLELFFVISLIGLLIVIELTSSFSVTPQWRSRLKWLVLLGLVGFAYIVMKRIIEILPSGVI